MLSSVGHWLRSAPIQDPVEQRQAVLFQMLLILILIAVPVAGLASWLTFGPTVLNESEMIVTLFMGGVVAVALLVLRTGRFRLSVGLVVVAMLAALAHVLYNVGIDASHGEVFLFFIPMSIAGLVMGRRTLTAATAASALIVLTTAYLELSGRLPVAPSPNAQDIQAVLVTFLVTGGVLAIFIDQFGSALRGALAASLERAQALEQTSRTLEAEHERLAVTLASIGDAVIATGADGRITFINPVAGMLTGWQAAHAVGKPLEQVFTLIGETTREPVENLVSRVLREGHSVGLGNHTTLHTRDGREIPIDASGAPIRDHAGSLIGVILVFRDVSARKQSEQRTVQLLHVMNALAQAVTLEEVARVAIGECLSVFDSVSGLIALREDRTDTIHMMGDYRMGREGHERMSDFPLEENNITAQVIRTGQPVWIHSFQEYAERYPGWASLLAEAGGQSAAGIPLIVEGRVLGALVFASTLPQAFREEDRSFITAVAYQVANALERARLYRRSEEERERFRVTLASIGDAVIATDASGAITFMNEVAERLTGCALAEVLGSPLHDVFAVAHEGTGEPLDSPFEQVLRTGEIVALANHAVLARRDGVPVPIDDSGAPIRDREGRVVGVILVFRDVTERREGRRRLEDVLARTQDLYEISREIGSARTYRDILNVFVSSRYLNHVSRANILTFDRPWEDPGSTPEIVEISALWKRETQEIDRTGYRYPFEQFMLSQLFRRHGPLVIPDIEREPTVSEELREMVLRPVGTRSLIFFPLIASGVWYGMLALHRTTPLRDGDEIDLEHIRSLADQVAAAAYNVRLLDSESFARREAETANQVKMKFLAMISHELRTPLTSIKGFITTLLAPDVKWSDVEEREFLEIISSESDRLVDLVEQLLDLTRLQAGTLSIHRSRQSLPGILANVLPQLLILSRSHTLNIDVPDSLPPVLADPTRVAQVVTNLVHNAAKYSPDGTSIDITAHLVDRSVQVDITDGGPGIPPEQRELVFAAFHQVPKRPGQQIKGAGLGLAIARGLVEAHSGQIWVADRPTPGTTICFTLPLAEEIRSEVKS